MPRRPGDVVADCWAQRGDWQSCNRIGPLLPGCDAEYAANGCLSQLRGGLLLIVLTGVAGLAGLGCAPALSARLVLARKGPGMRRTFLVLPAAALVLTACGSAPKAAASNHPAVATTTRPAPETAAPSPSRSPSPSSTPLIADTATDVATCHQFAAERAGQMSADQFNAWLLQNGGETTIGADSSTGMDNTLSTTLGDWYVVQAARPSGDLQPASYYAAEVGAECLSIGA